MIGEVKELLKRIQKPKYASNRFDLILPYCKNKVVLDLGCSMHDQYNDRIVRGEWLHDRIAKVAKKLVGVDYLEDQVIKMRKLGYDIRNGDVERLEELGLEREFDVVVAGELIEHLSNPGIFLDEVRKVMKKEGFLILTTPNCFSYSTFFLLKNKLEKDFINKEHKCWYSEQTLRQLLKFKNYKIENVAYSGFDWRITGFRTLKNLLRYNRFNKPHYQFNLFVVAKLKD